MLTYLLDQIEISIPDDIVQIVQDGKIIHRIIPYDEIDLELMFEELFLEDEVIWTDTEGKKIRIIT